MIVNVFIVASIEKFQCPVCHAIGQNAEATCDKNVKYDTCNRHNAVCQLSKKATTDDMTLEVTRKCSDAQTFHDENEKCKQDSNCLYTAYCLDSRCMANAPGKDVNSTLLRRTGSNIIRISWKIYETHKLHLRI